VAPVSSLITDRHHGTLAAMSKPRAWLPPKTKSLRQPMNGEVMGFCSRKKFDGLLKKTEIEKTMVKAFGRVFNTGI
jgi:hypothetical protein